VRALRDGIPRAFKNHRTPEGCAYGCYVRAKLSRLGGSLPADARPWLRAAGLLVLDLDRLRAEVEATRAALANGAGVRRREKVRVALRQLERREARLLMRLEAAERRLEELAAGAADPHAALRALVARPAPPSGGADA